MAENENNPFQLGTKVEHASEHVAERAPKPSSVHGLGWFLFAIAIFAFASLTSRFLPPQPGYMLRFAAAVASLVYSCIGSWKSLRALEFVDSRSPWSSLLNFISFFLNSAWSLLIICALVFLVFEWF